MTAHGALDELLAGELDAAYRRRFRTVVEWLAPDAGDRVLDAGCGRGFQLGWLHRLSPASLTGLERDGASLAVARRALGGRGVRLVRGDVGAPPFRPASFDAVVLSEVLEHVADDRAVLRAVAALLRPGGRIAITVPHADYPFWWDPLNKSLAWLGAPPLRRGPLAGIWTGHRRLYTLAALRACVEAAGLTVLEERRCTHHCLPFAHNLLYGLGKPLLDAGLLPGSAEARLDRHGGPGRPLPAWHPVELARRLVDRIDASNPPAEPEGRSSVNLCLLAASPGGEKM